MAQTIFFVPVSAFSNVFMTNQGTTDGKLPIGGVFAPMPASADVFVLGHLAQAGTGPAAGWVMAAKVTGTNPTNPYVVAPTGFALIWQDPPSNVSFSKDGFMPTQTDSLWMPVAPDGYVALGAVGSQESYVGFGKAATAPKTSIVWCLNFGMAAAGQLGNTIWSLNNYNNPIGAYQVATTNLFLASNGPPLSAPLVTKPNAGF